MQGPRKRANNENTLILNGYAFKQLIKYKLLEIEK